MLGVGATESGWSNPRNVPQAHSANLKAPLPPPHADSVPQAFFALKDVRTRLVVPRVTSALLAVAHPKNVLPEQFRRKSTASPSPTAPSAMPATTVRRAPTLQQLVRKATSALRAAVRLKGALQAPFKTFALRPPPPIAAIVPPVRTAPPLELRPRHPAPHALKAPFVPSAAAIGRAPPARSEASSRPPLASRAPRARSVLGEGLRRRAALLALPAARVQRAVAKIKRPLLKRKVLSCALK